MINEHNIKHGSKFEMKSQTILQECKRETTGFLKNEKKIAKNKYKIRIMCVCSYTSIYIMQLWTLLSAEYVSQKTSIIALQSKRLMISKNLSGSPNCD